MDAELLVDLVPTHASQVVALLLEEQVLQKGLRALLGGGLARSELAVDIEQRLVRARCVVLLQRGHHDFGEAEPLGDLLGRPTQRLEQHRDRLATLAVDTNTDRVALVDIELEPRTATRNDLHTVQVLLGRLVDVVLEVHTGRTHELRHDDTLGAVDDECAHRRHHGEITHEDRLALDFTSVVVDEFRGDEQRRRVSHVLVFALVDRRFDFVEAWVRERQRHGTGEVLDRGQLGEDLLQATGKRVVAARRGTLTPRGCTDQPLERISLEIKEPWYLQGLTNLCERNPFRGSGNPGICLGLARDCQDASFQHLTRAA